MIQLSNVNKTYTTPQGQVSALAHVDLHIQDGEFLVVRGPSGSGKTTMLLTIGGMLHPTSGSVSIQGQDIYAMSPRQRSHIRATHIGFVFQMFHLVPYLNVLDNVCLPEGAGAPPCDKSDAMGLLERLQMTNRALHKPAELSAGERQRAAVARALLYNPRIVLADEPTGNLDPVNGENIFGYLAEYHRSGGTVAVVTHGTMADQYADRIVQVQDGCISNTAAPQK
jgi:putative ABC transport system ATP-binding protein